MMTSFPSNRDVDPISINSIFDSMNATKDLKFSIPHVVISDEATYNPYFWHDCMFILFAKCYLK